MNKLPAVIAPFASVLLLGGVVLASGKLFILQADAGDTQVSGSGPSFASIGPTEGTDYQGMFKITVLEDADSPCRLLGQSRHLNTYVNQTATFAECDGGSPGDEASVAFTDSDTYIRGVQVCSDANDNKIKGVRIYGAKLNRETGALTNVDGNKQFERANCKTWKSIRYCPAGKIATKVGVAFTNTFSGPDMIGGLGLTCRTPTVKP